MILLTMKCHHKTISMNYIYLSLIKEINSVDNEYNFDVSNFNKNLKLRRNKISV